MAMVFNNVQELYNDMVNNCKYFTLGIFESTYANSNAVSGEVMFGNFEFLNTNFESGNNELQFWQSTKSDGANLYLHNVVGGNRVGDPESGGMLEYNFQLKNVRKPFSMLAIGWDNKDD